MSRRLLALLTALSVLAFAAAPAAAQSVADFYRGKTITMVVGTSPGGAYDLRLRMVARHIGRHLPGTASGSFLYPHALNRLVGTKFKIVTGYPGGNDINLAMERGEVGGRGSNSWASWKSTRPQWLAEKKVFILVQVGVKRNPELAEVPTMQELAKNDADRQVLEFISADTAISRPLVTNAGVPRERVAALRRAFDATMKDPEFLAEAERTKTDISPMTGEEAHKIATATIHTQPDGLARR